MCDLSEGIYEHGHHDGRIEGKIEGKIEQALSAILATARDFGLPIDKVFQSITKDLSASEKEEVAKQMKRKLDLH